MNRSPRIAIATCRVLPEPDFDEDLLNAALREKGAEPTMVPWDPDPADAIDLGAFDLCVLRSPWNYPEEPAAFRRWLARAARATSLWNPLEISLWNLDKRYLEPMKERGIPIIPTIWSDPLGRFDLRASLETEGWEDFVVKPTISAGSFATRRFSRDEIEGAKEFIAENNPARGWMVQKYLPAVETSGERAIVVIDGEITHSVRKSPRFSGDDESVSEALVPSDDEREFAKRALAEIEGSILYGRVDVIPDSDGSLRLAELELLEPSLFLAQHPPALERFVDAILARVGG